VEVRRGDSGRDVVVQLHTEADVKDKLADPDWLESLGFTRYQGSHKLNLNAPDEHFPVSVVWEPPGASEFSMWLCGDKPVCDNPTREQVRALFKGLCLQFPNGTEP
jgi:hypothetical protein